MYTIRNGHLAASVDPLGAELRSLRTLADDEEYLWQNETGHWPHSAPILFPYVGRLRGGGYRHKGRDYRLPIHGFAASERFELLMQQPDRLTFRLNQSLATQRVYPFGFSLRVDFALQDKQLLVSYEVLNLSGEILPFCLGSHPAFRLPLGPAGLADYRVEFSAPEQPYCYRLEGELLSLQPTPWPLDQHNSVPLREDLFDQDALIFKHIRSDSLRLVHREHGTRLTLHTGGAPHLGLWARPGAPYVCIEPWFGVDDDGLTPANLLDKPAINKLPPGGRFTAAYRIAL